MPPVLQIANKIILIHREQFGESPSPMKLQKLCYYAQGYYLGMGKGGLFEDDFEAWVHGPVVPQIYHQFKENGWRPILAEIAAPGGLESFEDHLCEIVKAYGRYDGAALSMMTHSEPPWKNARKGLADSEASSAVISKEAIREYFAEVVKTFQ